MWTHRRSVALVLSLMTAFAILGCSLGDEPASAVVEGQRYAVGPVDDLAVSDEDLTPYATIAQSNSRTYFLDDQAYALRDVDPGTLLVIRASIEIQDDAEWGRFVGLWGPGKDQDLCPYYDRESPRWCE